MGLNYFFETYIPLCDRWILADNSSNPFKIVAEGDANGTYIKDEVKFKTILNKVYPDGQ